MSKYTAQVLTVANQWLELEIIASSTYTAKRWLKDHVFKPGVIKEIRLREEEGAA